MHTDFQKNPSNIKLLFGADCKEDDDLVVGWVDSKLAPVIESLDKNRGAHTITVKILVSKKPEAIHMIQKLSTKIFLSTNATQKFWSGLILLEPPKILVI